MFISEPKTVYDVVKPLVYFNCFIGLGAFRLPNISDTVYFFMKIYTVMFTVSNLVMTCVSFNAQEQFIDLEEMSSMAITMYKILISVNSSTTVIAPVLLWLRRKVLRDCLQQMTDLIDIFGSDLETGDEYKKQYIRLIYQITVIVLVTVMTSVWEIAVCLEVELRMNIRSILFFCSVAETLHRPILVMLLLDVNFCTFVGYLGDKFRNINDRLLELTKMSANSCPGKMRFVVSQKDEEGITTGKNLANDKPRSLRRIRKAHLGLSKLARSVNLAFGIQNLISAGTSFAIVTGLLYTIYSALSWHNFTNSQLQEAISSCMWTTIYAFKIWLVNHSCWSVSNEAGRTGEVIYELLDSQVDEELLREIQDFGMQMLQNPVQFNACGFFTLHHSFVQGVIGSITTYLIILIQMTHTSETLTSDTSLAGNSTKIPAE